MLSVTIITKNAAQTIEATLESIKWANEIIVLDSGSTDNTIEICKRFTDKVFETDWPGFGIQKQRALEKASGEWVLSLDADEVITGSLKTEIEAAIKHGKFDGYHIPRRTVFYGKLIRFADGHDAPLRLVKKAKAHFTKDTVHESLIVDGKITILKNHMKHYSIPSISSTIEKMNRYTDISALARYQRGKKGSVWRGFFNAIFTFIKMYIFKCGFLDGKAGLVLCMGHANGAFYRYVKLYYLKRGFDYNHNDNNE